MTLKLIIEGNNCTNYRFRYFQQRLEICTSVVLHGKLVLVLCVAVVPTRFKIFVLRKSETILGKKVLEVENKIIYDDADELILNIIGQDSPAIEGLPVPESSGPSALQISVRIPGETETLQP